MRKTFKSFAIFFLLSASLIYSQSYLGYTNQDANLRESSSSESIALTVLPQFSNLYIFSLITYNDYYHVIDIETAAEGYVYKDFVEIVKILPKSTEKLFQESGYSANINPQVKVTNRTSENLTLKLNNNNYTFSPYETSTITLSPGQYDFVASCPGVLPYYGSDYLEKNVMYTWEFYIYTK